MKPFCTIVPAVAVFLFCTIAAAAQGTTGKKSDIDRLKEEIRFIDKELKTATSRHKESYNQLLLIQKKSANRKKLVEESDRAINDLQGQIYQKDREIASLQAQLDTLEKYYASLVYNTYKNRDNRVWLMYLLSSENPGQGYRRFSVGHIERRIPANNPCQGAACRRKGYTDQNVQRGRQTET